MIVFSVSTMRAHDNTTKSAVENIIKCWLKNQVVRHPRAAADPESD